MDYNSKLNRVAAQLPPSGIRKFFDLAATMEGVISLGVGQPDFPTPWHVREAAIESLRQGITGYTANAGLIELRSAISEYLKRRYNIIYKAEQLFVTIGGSQALDVALRALLNPGDEVIVLSPAYVAYEPLILMAGGSLVTIELKVEDDFKLKPEALKQAITSKTKVLLVNFPSNPTGGVMSYDDYAELIDIIYDHQLIVISDEIYSELTYDQPHASLCMFDKIKDQIVLINGFSKAYSMTGFRVGYVCAHPDLIKVMLIIHQYSPMCPATTSQYAALEACRQADDEVIAMREEFRARRQLIVDGFNRIGLACHLPNGAFYVFVDIRSTGLTSEQFCEQLLAKEKVAVVPGHVFGKAGEGFVRVSYAYSQDQIALALHRMEQFMLQLNK
jgi:aminotransferase